jgi:hypothetical protein
MATTHFNTFTKVSVLDNTEKNILSSYCTVNLKITSYNESEVKNLSESYQKLTFSGILAEVEIVARIRRDIKPPLISGQKVKVSIFDKKFGCTSNCDVIILQQERTHKLNDIENLIFFTGVRSSDKGYDGLGLFGFYSPKVFLLSHKKNKKLLICKSFSQERENEIKHGKNYDDYEIYSLSDFLEDHRSVLIDGGLHALEPR